MDMEYNDYLDQIESLKALLDEQSAIATERDKTITRQTKYLAVLEAYFGNGGKTDPVDRYMFEDEGELPEKVLFAHLEDKLIINSENKVVSENNRPVGELMKEFKSHPMFGHYFDQPKPQPDKTTDYQTLLNSGKLRLQDIMKR